MSESDKYILSKNVSYVASMADVLFPEMPSVSDYVYRCITNE